MDRSRCQAKALFILLVGLAIPCLSLGMGLAQSSSLIPQGPQNVVLQDTSDRVVARDFQKSDPWGEFTARYGRGWHISVDRRSLVPAVITGQGIPWISQDGGDLDALDQQARAFLRDHFALMRVDPGHLVLNTETSGHIEERSGLWYLNYDYFHNGVPVLGAHVTFQLNRGNLVRFGAEKVGTIDMATTPEISKAAAFATALRAAGGSPGDVEVIDAGTLYILPLAAEGISGRASYVPGEGYVYKLIYQSVFRFPDDPRTIVAQINAHTGAIVDLYDDTKYGIVAGGIYPRTVEEVNEVLRPFPFALVLNNGDQVTDLGGHYNYSGGPAAAQLNGRFFTIADGCGNPSATTSEPPGILTFGDGKGTDCDASEEGSSTHAARNAFYHLNIARQIALKYLTGIPRANAWLHSNFRASVNGRGACNASFSFGRVNFLQSSERCNNTAEIADVLHHEWGHGLDANTKMGTGDLAKGEAVGDLNAMFITHSRCIGPGFLKSPDGESKLCPTAVRDAALGPMTVSNAGDYCPMSSYLFACRGALRYECHCEAHILTGAVYDLAQMLVARYGENEGWRVAERLFYLSLPTLKQYLPGRTDTAYDSFVAAADDNGNLEDGVPDGDLIYAAFAAHEIAGPEYRNFRATCLQPPATPAVTARPGDNSVTLTWNPVPGAQSYQILRRIPEDSKAFLPAEGNVVGTAYVDTQVANGTVYDYMVIAEDGNCTSRYGQPVSVMPGTSLVEAVPERPPLPIRQP